MISTNLHKQRDAISAESPAPAQQQPHVAHRQFLLAIAELLLASADRKAEAKQPLPPAKKRSREPAREEVAA